MVKATKPEPVVETVAPAEYSYEQDIPAIEAMKSVESVYLERDSHNRVCVVVVTAKDTLTHPEKKGYLPQIMLRFLYFPQWKEIHCLGQKYLNPNETELHPIFSYELLPNSSPQGFRYPCWGDNEYDARKTFKDRGLGGVVSVMIMALQTILSEGESEDDSW